MIIHQSCSAQNDISYISPIKGKRTVREALEGVWTRTTISSGCGGGGGGGSGSSYGPGGSGPGIMVKSGTIKEGGTSSRPVQNIVVFTGGS